MFIHSYLGEYFLSWKDKTSWIFIYFLANSKMSSQAKTKVQPLDKATIHNSQFSILFLTAIKLRKIFQCSNVLLILPKCWTFKIPSWKQIKISENQEKFFSNRMINAFYAREKKRHSAAQHTGENPFGHTVQWLQTNKYEIYISILLLPCITSI